MDEIRVKEKDLALPTCLSQVPRLPHLLITLGRIALLQRRLELPFCGIEASGSRRYLEKGECHLVEDGVFGVEIVDL